MRVTIYVEGGGGSKELHSRCRDGFRRLFEKAGFAGCMPAVVACGGRNEAYGMFRTAIRADLPDRHPMLLVDREEPIDPLLVSSDGEVTACAASKPATVGIDRPAPKMPRRR